MSDEPLVRWNVTLLGFVIILSVIDIVLALIGVHG